MNKKNLKIAIRYAVIGGASNLAGYLSYLAATALGAPPKLTMSLLYGVSALIGYIGQRNIAFSHAGNMLGSGVRYLLAHSCGYILNLSILVIFVDLMGFPHQWIQAGAIFAVAAFLYFAFRYFVFPDAKAQIPDYDRKPID